MKVWFVGSSIVKRAFLHSRSRPGGMNLGLERLHISIWWQGYGGLGLTTLLSKLKTLQKVGDQPDFVVLHCGANDIGSIDRFKWRNLFVQIFMYIKHCFPAAQVVWSQMLPRLSWRYSDNLE